ncbi:ribosomal protein L40E [Litorivivens lipolytica]|uniref:Ribosomal protein L40E n=1 Tax=Litorivivens lipolytica TaxID=1524264 RepID=A0A7W4Z8F0_9GAMM|nr:hypothetical protein [Litorivivens lipolytica]MBB3048950.1 ribosomal protein L40E [Litorivivens lipolytica]
MVGRIFREGASLVTTDYQIVLNPGEWDAEERQVTESRQISYEVVSVRENAAETQLYADLKVANASLGVIATFGVAEIPQECKSERKPVIEMNLVIAHLLYQQHKQGFRQALQEKLLGSAEHNRWLYHPRETSMRKAFMDHREAELRKIEEKRLASDREYAAQQEQRRKELETVPSSERERIDWLAKQWEELALEGHSHAAHCQNCMAAQADDAHCCRYCGSDALETRPTGKGILLDIRYKFLCWGYGVKSLKAMPTIGADQ